MDFFNLLEEKNIKPTLANQILAYVEPLGREFSLKELYGVFEDVPETTIRGRINRELKELFVRLDKGLYITIDAQTNARSLIVEGDGRDLSMIPDNFVDAIVTDHPWSCPKSHKGTNKELASFDSFKYSQEDFTEKFRVLKEGGFLVENLPEESANNFDYIYEIKKMAEKAGFKYYCPVPWKKGNLIHNTGRKSKCTEVLYFFTKGKARSLKRDVSKEKRTGEPSLMSGTSYMLPSEFNFSPAHPSKKLVQTEKPIELYIEIVRAISLEKEVILDQFGGSFNLSKAANKLGRHSISFEIDKNLINKSIAPMNLERLA